MRGAAHTQIAWPKPQKPLIILMAANVVIYVLQLLLLRAGMSWVTDLYLSPAGVFDRGFVWQPLTHMWLHSPDSPFHLLFNLIWLWLFGSQLERWWGPKRFLTAYLIFGLSGAALTLIVGLLSTTAVFGPLLGSFWVNPHLGASGAVMGVTLSWGLTFANQEFHFLLLGRMKGKTFVLIIIAIELLVALSYSPVSSTSHFGGMAGAFILCRGLWRPSKWKQWGRKAKLQKQKKKIEHELRVLEGGAGKAKEKDEDVPDDPKKWN